jgi:UDP-glucose 4-epimerase
MVELLNTYHSKNKHFPRALFLSFLTERANIKMKILITGGGGVIGSHLVEHFRGKANIRVVDNLCTGNRLNLEGTECEFQEGSILDRQCLRQAMEGVEYVFHLAAMVSVPESMEKPLECKEINTAGTLLVLEEAARAGVTKLVFSSSAAVYGNTPKSFKSENDSPEPGSPYAISKYDGEVYCQQYVKENLLSTVSLRYFNVFGPRQNPLSTYAAAVPIFIERALRNEPIIIFGDGEQTRDFIFVKDVIEANIYTALVSSATGVFNVAGGQSITINELAQTILELTQSRSRIIYSPSRPGDTQHSCANINKLVSTGFSSSSNFLENIKITIEWFRDNLKVKI